MNRLSGKILTVEVKHYKRPRYSDLDPSIDDWHTDKSIGGEGYFYDLAPHTLDILDFLLGEIEEAKGYSQNLGGLYDVKDTISAVFKFKSGVLGVGQWCFVTSEQSEQDVIEIVGTEGKISFSTFAFTPILLLSSSKTESYNIPHRSTYSSH